MKEKGLMKRMAKENRMQISYLIMGMVTLILGGLDFEDFIGIKVLPQCSILIACTALEFYTKYNRIWRSEANWQPGGFGSTRLLDVLRFHSFSVHRYYALLRKRFFLFQVIGTALFLLSFFLTKSIHSLYLIILLLIIPVAVGYLYECYAGYNLTHRKNSALSVIFSLIESGINGIGKILAFLGAVLFSLFCMGIFLDNILLLRSYDDKIPARAVDFTGSLMLFIVIAFTFFMLSLLINSLSEILLSNRMLLFVRFFLGGLVVVLFCVYVFVGTRNYMILTEESFMVTRKGESTEYTLDHVTGMDIYAGRDHTLQAKLSFDDGKSEELFADMCSDTDGWSEKYYSDYNYAAYLVREFTERGIPCTLRDTEVLRKDVSAMDQDCQEGFEEIAACLEKQ